MEASKGAMPPIDVLVIDDEEHFLEACSRTLEGGGYRTAVAKTGQQGLQMAGSAHPGVVLLGLKMPGMSGLEALAQLTKMASSAVPVVVTGQSLEAGRGVATISRNGSVMAPSWDVEKLLGINGRTGTPVDAD